MASSCSAAPIVSPTGIIHVLGYTPTEGEPGVPVTVRIHFHPDLADAMFVRLVVGTKAVPTKVKLLPAVDYGRWQLYANAPPFDPTATPDTKVPLSVQALNDHNDILDTVTFGEFSYWAPGHHHHHRRSSTSDVTALRRPTKTRLHRRIKAQSLVRTKQQRPDAPNDDLYAQTPVLELVTPLANMCAAWSPAEIAVGRRLIRFTKLQDGRRLIVSCEPISQDDFSDADAVISCIYRDESDSCYVTSVDVIYLLERITNGEFPVEEKNRIRRNLEGLRPTTVSKHKPGFGHFFQRIMEFPDPKPRNIEKDLKVFDWNLLGQALEKILSKYSIYTSGADPDESSPSVEPTSSSVTGTESPELFALQLSYPPQDEATTSRFLDQQKAAQPITVPKYESFAASEYALRKPEDIDPAFASPVDSVFTGTSSSATSSCAAFPVFASDGTHAVSSATDQQHQHNSWDAPFKVEMMDNYHILSSYEVDEDVSGGGGGGGGIGVGMGAGGGGGGLHTFGDNPALDFDLYDTYAFAGIADETLANLADQYMH